MPPSPGFERAFELVLRHEGLNYVDDPDDNGGPTRYGVTLNSWQQFVGRPQTAADIRALTVTDAYGFYLAQFWTPLQGDALFDAGARTSAIVLFDVSVLHGLSAGVRMAQSVAKARVDGIVGPQTLAAIGELAERFVPRFVAEALRRCVRIVQRDASKRKFLPTWTVRHAHLLDL